MVRYSDSGIGLQDYDSTMILTQNSDYDFDC